MEKELQSNFFDREGSGAPFDIKEYGGKFIRVWPLGLLSLIFCIAIAFGYLLLATRTFHINAKILIHKKSGGQSDALIDLNTMLGAKSSVDNEVEILNTKFLMDRLVRDEQFNIRWFAIKRLKKVEMDVDPYKIKIHAINDSIPAIEFDFSVKDVNNFKLHYIDPKSKEDKQDVFQFDKPFYLPNFGEFSIIKTEKNDHTDPDKKYSFIITSYDTATETLRRSLTINTTNKLASTIDIRLDYPLSAKGERILSGYIKEYIREDIKSKSRIADSTIKFIDERTLMVSTELSSIEADIQEFMEEHGLTDMSEQTKLLLKSKADYDWQVADFENKIQIMNAVEELLYEEDNRHLLPGSILGDDQTFSSLLSSYNSLSMERERLLLSYTQDNPFILNLDQRITTVKQDILKYIQTSRNNLKMNGTVIERNADRIKGDIRDVPAQERQFLDLLRQQQLKEELYLYLLQKREEIAVSNTSNIAGIRVIDPPKSEGAPFSPKRSVVLFVAVVFALAIPVTYIYLSDLLNTKVQNRKDIEKHTQVPVIAELSHNTSNIDLIEFTSSRLALAEQFRALRMNLQFMMPKPSDKVILVISGIPGEGKSFTSLNLANIYAASGKKVLLLEFDLRKPKLSKTYAGLNKVGISTYIVDQSLILNDFIHSVDDKGNLFFGASGPIPPNPAELILSPRVAQMIKDAKEQFDFVIIDAPPLDAVRDGQLLSEYADVTLYLVRANYTPQELLGLPEDIRQEGKIKNMAIILNDSNKDASAYYGYNYAHHISNGEGKKVWWKSGKK